MSCLARTDYNFGFAIFCYYLWISKEEKQNNLIVSYTNKYQLIIINGLLILIDIIFLLTVGSIWGKTVQGDDAWNSLSEIHGFALTTSVIELLLKVFK